MTSRAGAPAGDLQIASTVADVLARRAALERPPVSLAIPDAVALGVAAMFRSSTPSGQVLDRFLRTGSAEADALIEAARTEQAYASPEGHAALYCLIGWVRARLHRQTAAASTAV
ncbi:hypothetical protein [Geodermatophilus ruber]|uniref:hypothetical protein n=1 Tax=Geodermatophilus ruber TaxID=504800 RepID=UPI001FDF0B10|nr:hypothetical protein [Geodermatophilus ruber]